MATNKLKEQIKKTYLLLGSEIVNRENTFSERSESWQESVQGDEYQTETEVMQDTYDELSDLVVNLGIIFQKSKTL